MGLSVVDCQPAARGRRPCGVRIVCVLCYHACVVLSCVCVCVCVVQELAALYLTASTRPHYEALVRERVARLAFTSFEEGMRALGVEVT